MDGVQEPVFLHCLRPGGNGTAPRGLLAHGGHRESIGAVDRGVYAQAGPRSHDRAIVLGLGANARREEGEGAPGVSEDRSHLLVDPAPAHERLARYVGGTTQEVVREGHEVDAPIQEGAAARETVEQHKGAVYDRDGVIYYFPTEDDKNK